MSTDYNTYVGPYVRCAVSSVEMTVTRRACPNLDCANHRMISMRDAFCSLCGSAVGTMVYPDMRDAVDDGEVSDAIDERLTTAFGDAYAGWSRTYHAHIWKPNVVTPWRDCHLDRTGFALVEITPDQIRMEIGAFADHFADELATMRTFYGADAVTLHWGIVQDYN